MHFLDINGLYSFCALKNKFMTGKYEIVIGDNIRFIELKDCKLYYKELEASGVMLIRILPPKNLEKPFLLCRSRDNKVYQTLCSTCCEHSIRECNHSRNERAITGEYYVNEIIYAINLGYELLDIYEAYLYTNSSYFLKSFVEILDYMKLKNSNLFSNCKTPEQRMQKCTELNYLYSDLNINQTNVEFNPRKRTLYKLMANSFFGKFQQKSNRSKVLFISTQEDLEKTYFEHKIKNIFCFNDEICQVEIEKTDKKVLPSRLYNCLIGGQITAFARETVHKHICNIEKIGTVYYVDCDSIIFTKKKEYSMPVSVGEATGQFKYEITGDIINYYCFAIKNYSLTYKAYNSTQSITKVKGLFLQNELQSLEVNHNLFINFFQKLMREEQTYLPQVRNKRKHCQVSQKLLCYKFSTTLTGRRFIKISQNNYITFPYGFQNCD
jgi:hypothetical protein